MFVHFSLKANQRITKRPVGRTSRAEMVTGPVITNRKKPTSGDSSVRVNFRLVEIVIS